MKRVVLDTNVLISALISPFGNESQLLMAVIQGTFVPCFSRAILDEYAEVLERPKFSFPRNQINSLIATLRAKGLLVTPAVVARVSPDPDDDHFIACALAANADFLVTGNKRHFPASSCQPTKVVSASELLKIFNA